MIWSKQGIRSRWSISIWGSVSLLSITLVFFALSCTAPKAPEGKILIQFWDFPRLPAVSEWLQEAIKAYEKEQRIWDNLIKARDEREEERFFDDELKRIEQERIEHQHGKLKALFPLYLLANGENLK